MALPAKSLSAPRRLIEPSARARARSSKERLVDSWLTCCPLSPKGGTSASQWKFPAVYTWSDVQETIRNDYGRDLKPHARTTATTDRAHGSSAPEARAFDATEEQYSRTGAPGAHRVLAAAEGHNNEQIARRLRINRETARLWRRVWSDAQELLAAAEEEETSEKKALCECVEEVLADAPRSGAPATFTPEQVVQIVALACEDPREGSGRAVTHWTPRELADEAVKRGIVGSISVRSVGRFLGRGGFEAPQDALLAQQRALCRSGG